jgi:DDE superfamily endonuclease
MVETDGTARSAIVGWSRALGKLHRRIGHRFVRSEARERVRRYLLGLLGRVERKNGWQMAEAIGEHDPQGVQRLLNAAEWDAEEVRDDLREYVLEHLVEEETGVLIVDETGILKKGNKSVGVARQYTRTAGDTVNCQVGVFLAYSSEKGAAFIDRALYLPRAWTGDPLRRAEAGVPEGVVFRNKVELAQEMLRRAFEAGVRTRGFVLRTLSRLQGVAGGARPALSRDGPQDGRRATTVSLRRRAWARGEITPRRKPWPARRRAPPRRPGRRRPRSALRP